jgi:hypothetical protein
MAFDENDKVTLFSAMLHREAVTIAQLRVPDGTNEITQADALLNAAEIPEGEAVLVTLDAAHTQRETAESVAGKPGWDYLMTVKGNRPTLQRQVFDKILPLLRAARHNVMEERSRGRIKKWSCWITGAEGIDFPHASQAAVIPTPGTLGVSVCSGCCGLRVLCLSWCLFSRLRWRCPGMADARVSRRVWRAVPGPRSRAGGRFLLPDGLLSWRRLAGAGCEHGDLGFPGDGCLGRGGVREFRACFPGAF